MLKIKSYLMISLLLFAMIFNFAACTNDAETTSNELAGKTFSFSEGKFKSSIEFGDDTFIITSLDNCYDFDDCMCEVIETCSYTPDYDTGYMLVKTIEIQKSYIRNGKTIYTAPDSLPDLLEDYLKERTLFFKTLIPDISEYELKFKVYTSMYPFVSSAEDEISQDIYEQWKAYDTKYGKVRSEFYDVYIFKLEDDKFIVPEEDYDLLPAGKKIGDIYNDRFILVETNGINSQGAYSRPEFQINIQPYTLMNLESNITICSSNTEEVHKYQIISATNDNLRIAPAEFENSFYIYDKSQAFDCPVTYKNGKDKTTATIDIKGQKYSFDIYYLSKSSINEILKIEDEIIIYTQN